MSEYTREEILKLIEENGGPEGLDLSGKDLSGIDLSREAIKAELEKFRKRARRDETPAWYSKWTEGLNLQGANLQGACLRYANLQEAELYDTNLQRAEFLEANLQEAILWRANLQGARLLRANLQGASLAGADLREASLEGADLQGADLEEANLEGAITNKDTTWPKGFGVPKGVVKTSQYTRGEILRLIEENGGPEGLDLSGKDLWEIDLSWEAIEAELEKARERAPDETPVWYSERTMGINLKAANLHRANLTLANLRGAYLHNTNLQWVELWGANLYGVSLGDADLQGARLWDTDLQQAHLGGANLQQAVLSGADLQEALLADANLRGAELQRANLQESLLRDADFQGADLEGTNLQGADLKGANLQGARLRYSHLEKVGFFGAESLDGAYFYNVFLDDTRLKREQLGEAIGEELDGRYDEAKEAYLALKNNFAEIGRYDDAAWAYRKERRMEKMSRAPWQAREFYGESQLEDSEESRLPAWHPRVFWFYIRHTLKWLTDWFVELLCGYGESLWRVLVWMVLVVLGFAAYYQVSHAVVTSSQDATTSLWDHLIFSLGAFTTLQPARLQAARPGIELLTTIQAIIGISLAGLLGFVAGNRIRRS